MSNKPDFLLNRHLETWPQKILLDVRKKAEIAQTILGYAPFRTSQRRSLGQVSLRTQSRSWDDANRSVRRAASLHQKRDIGTKAGAWNGQLNDCDSDFPQFSEAPADLQAHEAPTWVSTISIINVASNQAFAFAPCADSNDLNS